jgi:subtilisin family serine protease
METTWVMGRFAAGAVRLASVLVWLLGGVLAVTVHGHLPGASREPAPGRTATVTLITGDRVHVQWRSGGVSQSAIVPAPGREGISFARLASTNASGQEDLSIVPADAQPLLANGLLDAALFNVSGLVRQGLATSDDSGTGGGAGGGAAGGAASQAASDAGGLPLIVTFAPARARIAPLLLTAATGVQQGHVLPSIGGVAVADGKGSAGAFWKWLTGGGGLEQTAALAAGRASSPGLEAGVAKVWLDGRAQPLLDQSGPQIGVPQAHALGLTGAGVTVAVLDTGIKADHPDLAGRIAESLDFTNTLPDARDDVGHGTHVAGIIGGTGAASTGRYVGVAPGVTFINGKVCIVRGCPFSAIIAGMEWAAPRARVINMSLGGGPTDGTDPMSQALDTLTAQHGTLFIVAAGNAFLPFTVSSPASAREALAVSSVTKQDTRSPFSSQGPRVGDFAIKPEIAAPGSDIVSARVPGTEVGDRDPVGADYVRVSGTSMATPHVVGAAALLLQQHPAWTNAQLRAALMSSAAPLPGMTVFQQGAGRLDVGRAVTQSVFASGTASFGLIAWPHDQPVTSQTVTYANYGSEAITLDFALVATDAQGLPAPDGMFTVNASTVTVPAHGTANAQITFTPANRTVGTFSGRLIATSGTTRVVTAVGVTQEPESFNLTLRGVGRGESFTAFGWVVHRELGNPQFFDVGTGRETLTLRLPRAQYQVDAGIISTAAAERSITLASEPEVMLDADRTVLLDATRAQRVTVKVDRDDTVPDSHGLIVTSEFGSNRFATFSFAFTGAVPYAVPTRPVTGRFYRFVYETVLGVPVPGLPRMRFSPIYTLVFPTNGRVPERLGFVAHDRDLARVRTNYHAQGVLTVVGHRTDFALMEHSGGASRVTGLAPQPLPSERVEYFTARPDITWFHLMTMVEPGGPPIPSERELFEDVTHRPGRDEAAWNRAPLGPTFVTGTSFNVREGNEFLISVAPYSGNQEGHYTQTFVSPGISGTTKLTRGGETLGEFANLCAGRFVVPETPGRYTLTCSSTRNFRLSALGTRAEATWSFTSAGPTTTETPLPLMTVRATGAVFGMNDAPAGRLFPLVLRVERPAGGAATSMLTPEPTLTPTQIQTLTSTLTPELTPALTPTEAQTQKATRITSLELDASYDDGVTWTSVPVLRVPGSDRGLAVLRHPRAAGFVSLRARAADGQGNTVTHTTIRAYGLTVVP